MTLPLYVQGAWFAGALLFILGLKGMSSPAVRARASSGPVRHGGGATLVTFLTRACKTSR
jgi:hypothetical protein